MIHGNTLGLAPQQLKRLEHVYRRRVPPDQVTTPELARLLTEISADTGRQVGTLINRRGQIEYVIVGDAQKIELPDFGRQRGGETRFRGLRLVHTHLKGEPLTRDDLTDLALLRLDMVAAIGVGAEGLPGPVYLGYLIPDREDGDGKAPRLWETPPPTRVHDLDLDFLAHVESLEDEFARSKRVRTAGGKDAAVLVGVTTGPRATALESMEELRELARTAGVTVLDSQLQVRRELDPRTLVGKGKLQEIVLRCMQLGAEIMIFDQELTPSQANAIASATELRVIDRTQLILDIFAQRAKSRDGKLQVELAQLKYMLPRLRGKGDAMSRLMGGIGGRGPGETKLRDRIHRLEKELERAAVSRELRRKQRNRRELPVISIVGYTNAGKSTMLAALTASDVYADDLLFATLDPSSHRLRFPHEREVILTDTVGFIRDLPRDLVAAFRATLEEMKDADLLLHVVDASDPGLDEKIAAVESILRDLELENVPTILVLNKMDRVPEGSEATGRIERWIRGRNAVAVSALTRAGLDGLVTRADELLFGNGSRADAWRARTPPHEPA
jgi:GTPase